mmetsp:Transcript_29640/g.45314  ORF Transcript_29640/g.45314 Transcript_29640/m.45314 type:complete len:471 (+) Transcript_29640:115-1527(+)
MGYATTIFVSEPVDYLLCIICYEVIEDATSCKECCHTFCKECLQKSLDRNASCPTCRVPVTGTNTNLFAKDAIDGLEINCVQSIDNPDGGQSSNKRRRIALGDGKNDGTNGTIISSGLGCDWKGQVKDLQKHLGECDWQTITCNVEGCGFECKRKDMETHLTSGIGIQMHMDLMKKEIEADYAKKLETIEENLVSDYVEKIQKTEYLMKLQRDHFKFLYDCRSWIDFKPDALFDFKIHQIRKKELGIERGESYITGLLCGIPGPTGTDWEGSLIPLTIRYNHLAPRLVNSPPQCRFPKKFFHINVLASGTVVISTLHSVEQWRSEMTLPEMLFSIQQLLAHPNIHSPSNSTAYKMKNQEPRRFSIETKIMARRYRSDRLIATASEKGMIDEDSEFIEGSDIVDIAENTGFKPKKGPRERPKPPDLKDIDLEGNQVERRRLSDGKECRCSCCAWGQTFMDDSKRMRYIFGV